MVGKLQNIGWQQGEGESAPEAMYTTQYHVAELREG